MRLEESGAKAAVLCWKDGNMSQVLWWLTTQLSICWIKLCHTYNHWLSSQGLMLVTWFSVYGCKTFNITEPSGWWLCYQEYYSWRGILRGPWVVPTRDGPFLAFQLPIILCDFCFLTWAMVMKPFLCGDVVMQLSWELSRGGCHVEPPKFQAR